jgi:hypothetical protein
MRRCAGQARAEVILSPEAAQQVGQRMESTCFGQSPRKAFFLPDRADRAFEEAVLARAIAVVL